MQRADVWAVGDAYEAYVGRWSRLVARDFTGWLARPAKTHWADIGCGTGALTQTILACADPAGVTGIDPSDGFIARAREQITDPRASFRSGKAEALPLADAAVDTTVSGLVLNFVSDPTQAVAEMRRVLRPGGIAAVYVWDYAGEMQLMRYFWDAAAALDLAAVTLDEGRRFPICKPEALQALFDGGGFQRIECRNIDVPTIFKDFDDYWSPFLGGQGPAPTYCATLSAGRQSNLREKIRAALPIQPDGRIPLVARAFAVRGAKPG
jgi:SAM-dependent methyltransferase